MFRPSILTILTQAYIQTIYVWNDVYKLGSKELWTNVLELYFVMLANHDQNRC